MENLLPSTARSMMVGWVFLVLAGACQCGRGVGGFATNFIHSAPLKKLRRGHSPRSRAGIPGVAGVLGLPAKPIIVWKRAVFLRASAQKKFGCFFRLLEFFLVLLGGVFVLLGCFLFFARQRDFLVFFIFSEGIPHRNGEFPLCREERRKKAIAHGSLRVRWPSTPEGGRPESKTSPARPGGARARAKRH